MMNIITHTPKIEKIVLTSRNIDKIRHIEDEERRPLRVGMINEIRSALLKGGVIIDPLTVNRRVGEEFVRLLDGQHRFEAIKSAILRDSNLKVPIQVVLFSGLTREDERAVYKTLQHQIGQSNKDFLNSYYTQIPVLPLIEQTLPVNIKGSDTKIAFDIIAKCHLTAKKQTKFQGLPAWPNNNSESTRHTINLNTCRCINRR
jgi:hypothetical protein